MAFSQEQKNNLLINLGKSAERAKYIEKSLFEKNRICKDVLPPPLDW